MSLYNAAGERISRDRTEYRPDYFQYGHIAASGRAALNFIQPLAFSLAATFWGPRCEASASYRALLVSPFSIPARLAGVDDRVGSLEVGKIANLVLASAAPWAEDVEIAAVFVDGGSLLEGHEARGGRG